MYKRQDTGRVKLLSNQAPKYFGRCFNLSEILYSADGTTITQLDGKIGSGYEKSDPPCGSHISGMETPKPIHFWKGHRKSGRNGVAKILPEPRDIGVPRGGDEKFSKYGWQYTKLKVMENASQWDCLFRDLITLGEAGRGGNAFLGGPGLVPKNAFPSLPASPRVIKFLNK